MSRRLPFRLDSQSGFIMPAIISLIIAAGLFGGAVLTIVLNNFFIVGNNIKSQQAFNIAEAGANYYLWHMAHDGSDFKDGQSTPVTPDPTLGYGPYVHAYRDDEAKEIGTFTLWIKPQGNGSTIATVRSIGKGADSNITRTVEAKIGATSFASYALVSDQEFWFGNDEAANGPVFSNVGIHMDGPNSDTVGAANTTYVPQSQYGGNGTTKNGVWCSATVVSPVDCNTRDKSSWLYPQPEVDFNQVSGSLCKMKQVALANTSPTACSSTPTARTNSYVPQYSTTGSYSVNRGYLVQLNPNGTYTLHRVSAENDQANSYTAALTITLVQSNIPVPAEGVLFVEDNVWVRTNPTFSGRLTIASGRLATTRTTNIVIADDVLYGSKNGSDAIGLVAENEITIAPYAPPDPSVASFTFEVNAATLAQSGSVQWPRYYEGTTTCTQGWVLPNQRFIYYGSVATRLAWTWNYSRSSACGDAVRDASSGNYISGVRRTETNYDYNMLYAPPPLYPVTGAYNILNWREVLTKP